MDSLFDVVTNVSGRYFDLRESQLAASQRTALAPPRPSVTATSTAALVNSLLPLALLVVGGILAWRLLK